MPYDILNKIMYTRATLHNCRANQGANFRFPNFFVKGSEDRPSRLWFMLGSACTETTYVYLTLPYPTLPYIT